MQSGVKSCKTKISNALDGYAKRLSDPLDMCPQRPSGSRGPHVLRVVKAGCETHVRHLSRSSTSPFFLCDSPATAARSKLNLSRSLTTGLPKWTGPQDSADWEDLLQYSDTDQLDMDDILNWKMCALNKQQN